MTTVLCLWVALAPQASSLDELVAAERAFARRSELTTTQEAFLSVLSEDATMFRPRAVNARESLMAQPFLATGLLRWRPIIADVAQSGELGYTSGPSESGPRGEPVRRRGHFVSIWERSATGEFRLKIDLGIGSPNALPVDQADAAYRPAARPGTTGRGTEEELRRLEQQFARESALPVYERLLSDSARVYRNGHEPTRDRASALQLLRSLPAQRDWQLTRVAVARSGELGYSLGTHGGEVSANYVRIWRRTERGWVIVIDVTAEIPAASEER